MLKNTGLPCVAVRPLAYTSSEQDAVGSFGADGFSKHISWHAAQVPCVKGAGKNRGSEQLQDDWERRINLELLAVSISLKSLESFCEFTLFRHS